MQTSQALSQCELEKEVDVKSALLFFLLIMLILHFKSIFLHLPMSTWFLGHARLAARHTIPAPYD